MAVKLINITYQNDENIQRQNFWTASGLMVHAGFMTEDRCRYFELVDGDQPVASVCYQDKLEPSVFVMPRYRNKGFEEKILTMSARGAK
jgi:hypothetical protein